MIDQDIKWTTLIQAISVFARGILFGRNVCKLDSNRGTISVHVAEGTPILVDAKEVDVCIVVGRHVHGKVGEHLLVAVSAG